MRRALPLSRLSTTTQRKPSAVVDARARTHELMMDSDNVLIASILESQLTAWGRPDLIVRLRRRSLFPSRANADAPLFSSFRAAETEREIMLIPPGRSLSLCPPKGVLRLVFDEEHRAAPTGADHEASHL